MGFNTLASIKLEGRHNNIPGQDWQLGNTEIVTHVLLCYLFYMVCLSAINGPNAVILFWQVRCKQSIILFDSQEHLL